VAANIKLPGGGESDSTDAILPDDRRLLARSYTAHISELPIQSNISTHHCEWIALCEANRYSSSLKFLLDSGLPSWHSYQISAQPHTWYSVCSDSLRLITTDFLFSRVRLVSLVKKILNRADILKILHKYILRLILFWWTNLIELFSLHANGTFLVYQQILHHDDFIQ